MIFQSLTILGINFSLIRHILHLVFNFVEFLSSFNHCIFGFGHFGCSPGSIGLKRNHISACPLGHSWLRFASMFPKEFISICNNNKRIKGVWTGTGNRIKICGPIFFREIGMFLLPVGLGPPPNRREEAPFKNPCLGGSGIGMSLVKTRPLISGNCLINSELMLNFWISVGLTKNKPVKNLKVKNVYNNSLLKRCRDKWKKYAGLWKKSK